MRCRKKMGETRKRARIERRKKIAVSLFRNIFMYQFMNCDCDSDEIVILFDVSIENGWILLCAIQFNGLECQSKWNW